MDNFVVSARKYRPATFNSVIGQSALTTTLKNAIKSNHLAHAYLFCGPRGVGKTTCARIFAKTINCEHLTDDFEACDKCESCVSFNDQRSFNIHELDAASNNGTDDIKYLIEQVRIPPQIGKYSVYIVDEVHMLSQAAFNAFLKTLEEPPAHAIFILATTEKHKIIPTILSRCQIYDFNRITVSDTVKHLEMVAMKEEVTVDKNALNIIAQKSDGGMRDALSIFDQLVSFCGNNISYQAAIENLNVLDYDYYFRLVEAFLAGQVSNSLLIFNEILNKGFDAQHFITGLSSHLRDVLVCRDPTTVQLLEVGDDIGKRYKEQARNCSDDFIFQALKLANDCDIDYRLSKNKRLLVELTLIRLCQIIEKKKSITTDFEKEPLNKISKEQATTDSVVSEQQNSRPTEKKSVEPLSNKPSVAQHAEVENKVLTTRPGSISINAPKRDFVQESPVQNIIKEPASAYKEPFSDEQFVRIWQSYSDRIPELVRISSFIKGSVPIRTGENGFEIKVSNVLQESELSRLLPDIHMFIREELKNSLISLSIRVADDTEVEKPATREEKYKRMSTENPALNILKNGLQLELD